MKSFSQKILLICVALSFNFSYAEVIISTMFSDNMVLQREKKIPIWGTADAGEKIQITFSGQNLETNADNNGNWKVYLKPLQTNKVGTGLKVNNITLSNILVGDVWLVSGQSNMAKSVSFMGDINKEILEIADNPQVRLYDVPHKVSQVPLNTIDAKWELSDSKSVLKFSAIGIILALKLQSETGIPIGIINSSLGSTSISCWLPHKVLANPPFKESYDIWMDAKNRWEIDGYKPLLDTAIMRYERKKKGTKPTKESLMYITESRTFPAGAYGAMLHPIFPFAIKGIVWRQGEANVLRAAQYKKLMPAMIAYWRTQFDDKILPFIQIGLPSYGKLEASNPKVAELRAIQESTTLKDTNSFYVPILDLMDVKKNKADIHPHNKYLAGERTANLLLEKFYGADVLGKSPQFEKLETKDSKIIITFKNVGDGLFTGTLKDLKGTIIEKNNAAVSNFWIASKSKTFIKASAKIISKNQIIVWSDAVKNPIEIRFAWDGIVQNVNVYNSQNLPINTFRTDDWDLLTKDFVEPKITLVRP